MTNKRQYEEINSDDKQIDDNKRNRIENNTCDLENSVTEKTHMNDINHDATHNDIKMIKTHLISQLSERSTPKRLVGMQNEYDSLHQILYQTISKGESNSCLLLGNRGTGKTTMVRLALNDLTKKFPAGFVTIRLNGLTETTDRIALNEIARQLMVAQGKVQQQLRTFATFAESFEYTLSLLKQGDKTTLPIVFILEEFDLFAQHPKQTLLYNLFDATQSAQNPMAVIGLTCRIDTLDLLEKRVKSRFSHRQIYLFPPATFGDFVEIARETLIVPEGLVDQDFTEKFNQAVKTVFEDSSMNTLLRRIFDITKDLRMFFKICFEPVSQLSEESSYLLVSQFMESSLEQRTDLKTEMLKGVSLLELVLIVSMKKLMERDTHTFNFQMIYDEYKDFMTQTQVRGMGLGMKLYKRSVALKAFESLQSFELVCPVEQIGKCPKEYRMAKLMLEHAQVIDAVLKYKDCPTNLIKWATGAT
ncbi:origin recognition complex subunit 4 C-terminus-domain-containing protein [Halteromyces radiatus]|uniref:origin recognition complex subunit 4 C-terminus-domain-containing protein n=1 Tax=Halteromyces radiatus TaxID=101107 RepID=UPI00221F95AF|nr:origin recognition complex subunit 4 C-terminus-domain-containing protein [Halteromyces radiatus]KAI8086083.1 origin recognition complex subunit 4 C-terminus-domain-containing protein [Halteromyces radiatus]